MRNEDEEESGDFLREFTRIEERAKDSLDGSALLGMKMELNVVSSTNRSCLHDHHAGSSNAG